MRVILLTLVITLSLFSKAQDQLVDHNSNVTLVKIIEIGDNYIKFKKYDNLDGPIYNESKSTYATIVYENGKIEVLNSAKLYKKDKSNRPRFTLIDSFRYNTLEFDFLSFYTNDVLVQYTHYLKNNNAAITIPFRAGWIGTGYQYNGIYLNDIAFSYSSRNSNGDYDYSRELIGYKFLTGLNYKFFWRDKFKIRGYAGPEFLAGYASSKANYFYSIYDPFNGYSYYSGEHQIKRGSIGLMGTIGMLAYPNELINFKLEVAGGFVGVFGNKLELPDYSYSFRSNQVRGIGRLTFSIGFNF